MLNLKYLNIALIATVFCMSNNQVFASEYFQACFEIKNNSLFAQKKINFIKETNSKQNNTNKAIDEL